METEIQTIARAITAYSLILKQIGLNLKSPRSLASTSAIDSVSDVAAQSQTIFNEIKGMVEMVQKKDDTGHIQSIAIAQRVKWCFKKQRVQYLLGQLEVLKLSLSLMLQVQQMARHIANSRYSLTRVVLVAVNLRLMGIPERTPQGGASNAATCSKIARKFKIWWSCAIGHSGILRASMSLLNMRPPLVNYSCQSLIASNIPVGTPVSPLSLPRWRTKMIKRKP